MRPSLVACSLAFLVPLVADAQFGNQARRQGLFGAFGNSDEYYQHPYMNNTEYDGTFKLARIWYAGYYAFGPEGPGWSHDFPIAEENLALIIKEITSIRPYMDGGNVFKLDDPELCKFPVAYLSEPGGWYPSPTEIDGLRNYLQKGGFLIVDDWGGPEAWMNAFGTMKTAFPKLDGVRLSGADPIFDSFFRIEHPEATLNRNVELWGFYENNDPTKRLMAIFNVNEDIGEYWQWSGTSRAPFSMANEAFKIGVNYVIYAMTH